MKIRTTQLLSAAAVLAVSAGSASAATITWQPSVNMYQGATVETFVDTTGTALVGVNGTDDATNGNVSVNGVAFTQALNNETVVGGGGESITVNGNNVHGSAFQDGEFSSNANIFHLIQGGVWQATSVDFAGLTIGQQYLVQVFTNDARSSRTSNVQTGFGDGTGSVAPVAISNNNNSPTNGDPAVLPDTEAGDSIIGTFTADATTQSFNVFGTNSGSGHSTGSSQAHVNAIQLRDLGPVPEPGSLALMGLGGLLIARRRRNG